MAASLSDQTVLIVEDQEGPHKALMMILSPFYRIYTAETACAALKIIVDCPIDLVIMDVGLPDYSGIELLQRVRASGQDFKVIVMSGGKPSSPLKRPCDWGRWSTPQAIQFPRGSYSG
jgi:two-component system, OmpR family, KDP operon response regulator KdpE